MNIRDIFSKAYTDELPQYALLLHYSDTHAKEAYEHSHGNYIDFLYAGTRLSSMIKYSPILIDIENIDIENVDNDNTDVENENENDSLSKDNILNAFISHNESQQGLTGLLIVRPASCTIEQLADQLRQRLFVYLNGMQEGLLHFSNPVIAQYLLSESSTQDTDQWLGVIEQLAWYSATPWGGPTWQHCTNQHSASDTNKNVAKDELWSLTHSQNQALQLPETDKELTRHMAALPAIKPTDADTWKSLRASLAKAKNLGLKTDNDLQRYLLLTCQYPDATHNHAHLVEQANTKPEQIFASLEQSIKDCHYV